MQADERLPFLFIQDDGDDTVAAGYHGLASLGTGRTIPILRPAIHDENRMIVSRPCMPIMHGLKT
jgi:hypothetical protein